MDETETQGLNLQVMNEDLRVRLIVVALEEAVEMDYTDEHKIAIVQAITRVPDGTDVTDPGPAETDDTDLPDVQYVGRLIEFHFGNL